MTTLAFSEKVFFEMNISTRISELLFEYECVVLPDFGGFITNNKPAQLNRITHQFDPPSREILFNVQLTVNDGLLAKYIAETESISYIAAKQHLTDFVVWCRSELEAGKQVEFAQIGSLFFDDARNIVFEQDPQINYNSDAFGLSSLMSPAIKRATQEEKIKGIILSATKAKKHDDRKVERDSELKQPGVKKVGYRFPLAIAGLLLAVVLITSLFLPNQSSVISLSGLFLPSSTETVSEEKTEQIKLNKEIPVPVEEVETVGLDAETEVVAKNEMSIAEIIDSGIPVVEETIDQSEELVIESDYPVESKAVVVETSPEKPEPTIEKSPPKIIASSKQYYIIAGSFSKEENAQKLIAQLSEKGYSAVVADTNKNGMYRVAYVGFSSKADAKQELLAIRQGENAEAWLLRK